MKHPGRRMVLKETRHHTCEGCVLQQTTCDATQRALCSQTRIFVYADEAHR